MRCPMPIDTTIGEHSVHRTAMMNRSLRVASTENKNGKRESNNPDFKHTSSDE